ncbi:hypothetical protein Tco_0303803 [Tanacetum coccineum]
MSVLPDDQMNSVINCLTTKSTWDDLILYHEGPYDVKESRVMDLKLCYNTFKFKEDSELASLFGKLKYEENLIDNIYEIEKSKSLISATPLSTAFFSASIVQDFQDNPNDEEATRSSHEYPNDLEEDYQSKALLAKSKRFFKKGTQRFSSTKVTNQTECHKCGKKGHFAINYWSKTSVPSYQSTFQPKLLHSSEHKPELRQTKDFKAKYNKVKAKLALFSYSASVPSSSLGKNKGLIAKMYDYDKEEVSSDENEVTEVKAFMALANEERISVSKESASNGEWVKISIQKCISKQIPTQKKKILGIDQLTEDTSSSGPKDPMFIKSSTDNSKVSITDSNKLKLSKAEDSTLSNHDTDKVPSNELLRNTIDHSVVISNSSVIDYDSADESLVCSTPFLH